MCLPSPTTHVQRTSPGRTRREGGHRTPRGEPSPDPNLAGTLLLDFCLQNCEEISGCFEPRVYLFCVTAEPSDAHLCASPLPWRGSRTHGRTPATGSGRSPWDVTSETGLGQHCGSVFSCGSSRSVDLTLRRKPTAISRATPRRGPCGRERGRPPPSSAVEEEPGPANNQ